MHSTIHRTAPRTKNYLAQNGNAAGLDKLCFRGCIHYSFSQTFICSDVHFTHVNQVSGRVLNMNEGGLFQLVTDSHALFVVMVSRSSQDQ